MGASDIEMKNTLPNAVELDSYIQDQQSRLYAYLCSIWGVGDLTYNSYPRTYRNPVSDGYIPEWYDPTIMQYVDGTGRNKKGGMFFEDSLAAMSFYGLADPVKKNGSRDDMAKVQLLFFVNLTKITPGGLTHAQQAGQRLDELAINDVRNFLQNNGCGFSMTDVCRDIDKVVERYSGAFKRSILSKNMNNFLAFRIDMQMPYNSQLNTTNYIPPMAADTQRTLTIFIKNAPDPTKKIKVGGGRFIQQEYAATNILIPCDTGQSVSCLAGKVVQFPFYYGGTFDQTPNYNAVTGQWDKTDVGGFQANPDPSDPGTPITITFTDFA